MSQQDTPLFRRLLGPSMGLLPRLICTLMGLPKPGRDVPVTVVFDRTPLAEHWQRRFGDRRYASSLRAGTGVETGLLIEHMGMITNVFRIEATIDTLYLTVVRCRFLDVPMPGWLAPRCAIAERQEDGEFTFDVPIELPWLGRLIHYRGRIRNLKRCATCPAQSCPAPTATARHRHPGLWLRHPGLWLQGAYRHRPAA
ncbi:DUF4166 domain-containing protein [Niveispirillum sp. BGYR6]|uniref:DUF4166 domain-containing protein n=1 Tax=Niveispirillum sp. BGYR6 TaxID=2971249 RepID=UPI0022B9A315|nr:DUF4166 domain-containing protein [Niveispirillum sp. BGYR6]MDG5496037.1 DUF4166 domain-containing protein [Niveispirillum sp. BGYR6]